MRESRKDGQTKGRAGEGKADIQPPRPGTMQGVVIKADIAAKNVLAVESLCTTKS